MKSDLEVMSHKCKGDHDAWIAYTSEMNLQA